MPTKNLKKQEAKVDKDNLKEVSTDKPIKVDGKIISKYGIKETSDIIIAVASIIYAFSISFDGKGFKWKAFLKFIYSFRHIPNAIKGIGNVPEELKDLQQEEVDQLMALIEKHFRLSNKYTEAIIEELLAISLAVVRFIVKLVENRNR